jgi:Restriction Enzyme Adenine Methylase Associated
MPFIRIDDAVYAHLRNNGRFGDTYNDIVRSLLNLPRAARLTTNSDTATMHGTLMPLIAAGVLAAGDTVTWYRRRRDELHTATIDEAGRMVTADGALFLTPDTCASTIAGYPCKGWRNWRTTAGDTLQQLRDRVTAETPGHLINTSAAD